MTDRELMQMALDALIDAADSQSWELQQNIDQHGEWYRRSVYLKEAVTKSQKAIESLRAALAQLEQEPQEIIARWIKANTEHKQWYICPKCSHQTPRWKDEWVGLTDDEILADDVLRYHFALNGGAGSISKKGRVIIDALNNKLKEKNHG